MRFALALTAALAAASCGSRPAPGEACTTNTAICYDSTQMLRCWYGKQTLIACPGAGGCKEYPATVECAGGQLPPAP